MCPFYEHEISTSAGDFHKKHMVSFDCVCHFLYMYYIIILHSARCCTYIVMLPYRIKLTYNEYEETTIFLCRKRPQLLPCLSFDNLLYVITERLWNTFNILPQVCLHHWSFFSTTRMEFREQNTSLLMYFQDHK